MSPSAYEAKFHSLSRYFAQLLGNKGERVFLFVEGLNIDLQVLAEK